jgi:hypothetical protein
MSLGFIDFLLSVGARGSRRWPRQMVLAILFSFPMGIQVVMCLEQASASDFQLRDHPIASFLDIFFAHDLSFRCH